MTQKRYSLIGCLMLAGVIAYPAMAGIRLRAVPAPQAQSVQTVSYLSEINKPLRQALLIHNLMNEMPMLRDISKSAGNLKMQKEMMNDFQKKTTACNIKMLGNVFKNPMGAWGKITSSYDKQRQVSDGDIENEKEGLVLSRELREKRDKKAQEIGDRIMSDVQAHPEKWGEINKGESFSKEKLAHANSILAAEYNMSLMTDSLEKGSGSVSNTTQKMSQPFMKKLTELGIDTKDFDISNRGQYMRVEKELKDLKKKEMEEAYKYVDKLEEQDRNNPELVAKREKLKAQKRARLSAKAQSATSGMNDVVQFSQMSPAAQQRVVLAALKKDENATVHLSEANAANIDQLMREKRSTNKIMAESNDAIDNSMKSFREMMPQGLEAECIF